MADPARSDDSGAAPSILPLIQILPEPCALLDGAGVLIAVNEAWRDLFVETGLGLGLVEACGRLFAWEAATWPIVEQDVRGLLAGSSVLVRFEAQIAEPPERWGSSCLALSPPGFIWQLADVTRWQLAESESTRLWQQFRDAVESISDGFALYDADDRLIFCNRRYREIYDEVADLLVPGRSYTEIVRSGVHRGQFADAEPDGEAYVAASLASHQSGAVALQQLNDGRWVRTLAHRTVRGETVDIGTDITTQRREEELRRQSVEQEATITAQAVLLAELSTPILRIGEGALVLPLVGSLDSYRAGRVVESLLLAVEQQRAKLVILDITGVPLVDTQVANVLLQAARAVQLLGARTVLTGIRPDVAQTIIALGADLSGIVTRADLQDGIKYALRAR